MAETIYINGNWIKEISSQYGKMLIMNGKAKTFIEEIQKHTDEKGNFSFKINERKSTGKNGETHYMSLNTYKKKEESDGLPF